MFVINVLGEIIAKDIKHYAQNWVPRSIGGSIEDYSYNYDDNNPIVQSNLILHKNLRSVPYAIYVTEKGAKAVPPGDLSAKPGAAAAELCYKDNISEIEKLLRVTIPTEIEVYFYNGLLTGIFSILELFLSDVLLCLIFTKQEVYERALAYMEDKEKGKKKDYQNLDMAIQKYFTEGIVYHRFKTVKTMYKNILQIHQFPDVKNIQSYLHKRNNIAHRFAFSNRDRMEMTIITTDILKELIQHCNKFVDDIMNEIASVY